MDRRPASVLDLMRRSESNNHTARGSRKHLTIQTRESARPEEDNESGSELPKRGKRVVSDLKSPEREFRSLFTVGEEVANVATSNMNRVETSLTPKLTGASQASAGRSAVTARKEGSMVKWRSPLASRVDIN